MVRASGAIRGVYALLCLGFALAASAEGLTIGKAEARFENDTVIVSAEMDLDPGTEAETALSKGIPLDFLIEFRLYRYRYLIWDKKFWDWLLWDKKLGEWTLRARVGYHALSGLYTVTVQGSKDLKTFESQRAALKYTGTLSRVSLPVSEDTTPESERYWLGLRVRLDVESLPAPLRPLAYTSPAWHLRSKWTRWIIQP